jgi:hypothetical protein
MSLTAYFFPTVTTQIANVMCKRSWQTSLFSTQFLHPEHRRDILESIRTWRPLAEQLSPDGGLVTGLPMGRKTLDVSPPRQSIVFPLRFWMGLSAPRAHASRRLQWGRLTAMASRFFKRHPIVLNLVSNPLIDVGILFELAMCALLFYSGLARIYWFAPVPWPIYVSAFHGTVVLLAFEETKKYFRRKGHDLTFLG